MPRKKADPDAEDLEGIPEEARKPEPKPKRPPSLAKQIAPLVALCNTIVALVPPLRQDVLSEREAALLVKGLDDAQIVNPALRRALGVATKAGGYATLCAAAVIILAPRLEAHGQVPKGTFPRDLYAETYAPPQVLSEEEQWMGQPVPPSPNGVPQESGGPVPYGYQPSVPAVFPSGA